MNQREQKTEEAVNAAWSQFQKMPSSNPGDYARAILRALERFEEVNTPTRTVIQITPEAVQREYELRNGITPANDEREALLAEADALVESWDRRGSWSSDSPVGLVMRFAAYLRRTVQGEPSSCSNPDCPLGRAHSGPCAPKGWQGAPCHTRACLDWCNHCQVCGTRIRFGSRCPAHYLNQEQGEPSDVAVSAAGEVLYGISWGTDLADPDLVRAALRAAAETERAER